VHLLNTLPDAAQRDRQELALQTMLGPVLIATKGNGAVEVGAVYKRAVELGRQIGESAQLFPVLFGLRSYHLVRAELREAHDLGEQLLSLSETIQDTGLALEANLAHGNTLFLLGDLISALEFLKRAIALYDPQKHHVHAFLYGLDPGVFCLGRVAWILALLGYRDQATKKMSEAFALAQQQSHAFTLAVTIVHVCPIFILHDEWPALQQQAEAAMVLCREQGFESIMAQATMYRGYALAHQGQAAEGIALMHEGLDAQAATGAHLFRAWYLCSIAEACGTAGHFEEGLTALAEATAIMERTAERLDEARLHQLKGDLILRGSAAEAQPGIQTEAEECFRKSIELARRQEAKLLELKAITSLSQLWKQQGKKAEARQALAEIYEWFSECFDTKDLTDAKLLIEQLS